MKCETCKKYKDCKSGYGLTWPCGAYVPKKENTDYKELIEDLRRMLPEKVLYGDLIGAEGVYAHSGPLVYEDPEPYFIEQAISAITELLARVENAENGEEKAADVRPVVHGRFVHDGPRFAGGVDWWHCSNCGSLVSGVETRFAFCPHCGADMRPENDG